jgi:hypothetical protein
VAGRIGPEFYSGILAFKNIHPVASADRVRINLIPFDNGLFRPASDFGRVLIPYYSFRFVKLAKGEAVVVNFDQILGF